jgi:hypothetical protein
VRPRDDLGDERGDERREPAGAEKRKEEKDKHFVRSEGRYGSFSRPMALPPGVDVSKIKLRTRACADS